MHVGLPRFTLSILQNLRAIIIKYFIISFITAGFCTAFNWSYLWLLTRLQLDEDEFIIGLTENILESKHLMAAYNRYREGRDKNVPRIPVRLSFYDQIDSHLLSNESSGFRAKW